MCDAGVGDILACGQTPQKAAQAFMRKLVVTGQADATAENAARNWAVGAFGLQNHCTAVTDWLTAAQGWSPQEIKEGKAFARKAAEMSERLCQSQAYRYQAAAVICEQKAQITALHKKCSASEEDAKCHKVCVSTSNPDLTLALNLTSTLTLTLP